MTSQAPGDAVEPAGRPLSEVDRVEAWRLERFLDMQWSPERAEHLVALGADWHDAERLLRYRRDFDWVYDQLT